MTEPQVWVLIGVFATAIFGMLSWQTISFNRSIASLGDRMDAKIDGLRDATDIKFDALRDATDAKFDALRSDLGGKIDGLDRDVQALTRHVFGADPR